MSTTPPATLDQNGEYIEHLPLLASTGWENLQLIYEEEPAGEMPANQLDAHALVICQGSCRVNYWLDGRWQAGYYTSGDMLWMPAPNVFPKVQFDRSVHLLEFAIAPSLLDQIAATEDAQINPLLKFRDPLIQQIGLSLQQELASSGADSKLYADAMSIALTSHLWRRYGQGQEPKILGGLGAMNLQRVQDYILANLDTSLSLAELATLVHLHPHYFAGLFKKSTGLAPYQYIVKQRIAVAQRYLAQPDLSIAQICQMVGFQNQSHFTRVFRQQLGVTPKVYRQHVVDLPRMDIP
jgi:AraC family transcriptional regulator